MPSASVSPGGNAQGQPLKKETPSSGQEPPARKRREDVSPGWFTRYYWLWRGSGGWQEFLRPPPGVVVGSFPGLFGTARETEAAKASTASLQAKPGVYEFAIAQPKSRSKVVVYVGESSDIRRRHHSDYRGSSGGHIKAFFEEALANGCTVYRRVKYLESKEAALKLELELLGRFNYAWNQRQNGSSRMVYLRPHCCCCCAYTAVEYFP